jgi:hypothetical protein
LSRCVGHKQVKQCPMHSSKWTWYTSQWISSR